MTNKSRKSFLLTLTLLEKWRLIKYQYRWQLIFLQSTCWLVNTARVFLPCMWQIMTCIFLFFHRWPKWRLSGPSLRTHTNLDHVLSRTQPSRANWSPPNTAAGYSSGTGEAAPERQRPSNAMRSVQKQPDYFWPLTHHWYFTKFKSLRCRLEH